jgi:hypothetical protein
MDKLYDTYKDQVGVTTQAVEDQLTSIAIVDKELQEMSIKMQKLYDDNNSKIRLIEINRYYNEKYDDHSGFMKYLIIFTIFYILLYLSKKYYLIKDNVYSILQFIIIFIGIVVMGRYFYRMVFRNNMEYNEYTFPFANLLNDTNSSTTSSNLSDPWMNQSQTSCPTGTGTTGSGTGTTGSGTGTTGSGTGTGSGSGAGSGTGASTCTAGLTQKVYGNNGSVSCNAYCGGINGKPWNNELPVAWNGASCVGTGGSATKAGCFNTFTNSSDSPGTCLCQSTCSGWNQNMSNTSQSQQYVYGNNGSVSCNTYCAGTGGKPWNNELPAGWNGAKCIGTTGAATNCSQTFSGTGSCLCEGTGTGWS